MKDFKKYVLFLLIVCALLLVGFYREFVFRNINALLQARDADMDYKMSPSLSFFASYEYDTLTNIKWLLTVVFELAYLLISVFTVQLLFRNKSYNRITIVAFAGVTIISALFICIGFLFKSNSEKLYETARALMGFVQSPVILMILIPAFRLANKEKS